MPPLRTGESKTLGIWRNMGERKKRRERVKEWKILKRRQRERVAPFVSVRRETGGEGTGGSCLCVFVCHENPADAARWGSETKLKGAIPCVFREIAHSSLIMYFSHRKPGKLTQTPSTKPASCSHKGKAGREKRIITVESERGESDFCDMLNVWTGLCSTIQFAVLSQSFL